MQCDSKLFLNKIHIHFLWCFQIDEMNGYTLITDCLKSGFTRTRIQGLSLFSHWDGLSNLPMPSPFTKRTHFLSFGSQIITYEGNIMGFLIFLDRVLTRDWNLIKKSLGSYFKIGNKNLSILREMKSQIKILEIWGTKHSGGPQ